MKYDGYWFKKKKRETERERKKNIRSWVNNKPFACQFMVHPPQWIVSKTPLGKGSLLLPKGLTIVGKPRSRATWARSTKSSFKPRVNVNTSLLNNEAPKLESVHPISSTIRIFFPHSMSGTVYHNRQVIKT